MILPRFYPILDTVALERSGVNIVSAASDLLAAGAKILQLRHKGHYDRALYGHAERIATLCEDFDALLVINDRADIAMLLNTGLHVGQDDIPPSHARSLIGANRVLGFSTHNSEQLAAAASEPIDYVAIGPIFYTSSKQTPDPVVGVNELRRLKSRAKSPLVAIGGITREKALEVWEAGADSIAVVGDLYPDVGERAREWIRLANE